VDEGSLKSRRAILQGKVVAGVFCLDYDRR
jgi:hypothetical protein